MRWGPLVQLGLSELQNRETRKSNETSRRVANAALAVSAASLLFTGAAVYYARDAANSGTRWEREQLQRLDALRQEVTAARASLEKVLAATPGRSGGKTTRPRK